MGLTPLHQSYNYTLYFTVSQSHYQHICYLSALIYTVYYKLMNTITPPLVITVKVMAGGGYCTDMQLQVFYLGEGFSWGFLIGNVWMLLQALFYTIQECKYSQVPKYRSMLCGHISQQQSNSKINGMILSQSKICFTKYELNFCSTKLSLARVQCIWAWSRWRKQFWCGHQAVTQEQNPVVWTLIPLLSHILINTD